MQDVGIEHDFFALGGHSLLAMQVISQVRAMWKIDLPLRLLFDEPTVAGLGRIIEERIVLDAKEATAVHTIRRIKRTNRSVISLVSDLSSFSNSQYSSIPDGDAASDEMKPK